MKIAEGERFSISLDEWTSTKNQRYMYLNLHLSDHTVYCLGMDRIEGSMTSEDAVEMIGKKLEEFGVDLHCHIVGMVTDGASVMMKLGRISEIIHQPCHSHGIHLAVVDVLYKKQALLDDHVDDKHSSYDEEEHAFGEDDDDGTVWNEVLLAGRAIEFQDKIKTVIQKIQKIAKTFRMSPLKNDLLQKYCVDKLGKELSLVLDTKTRWNSLLHMIARFNKVCPAVKPALVELSLEHLHPEHQEVKIAHDIAESLDIVEVGAKALSRRDMTILKSEKVFEYTEMQELTNLIVLLSEISDMP